MLWFWVGVLILVFYGGIWFSDSSWKSKLGRSVLLTIVLVTFSLINADRQYSPECNELTQQGDC
jgi:hypothetical protein